MRIAAICLILSLITIAGAFPSAAQESGKPMSLAERFGGEWAGSFDGDGTGKFELSITPGAESKHAGKVSVMPDGGESYTTSLKSVTLEGDRLVGEYDEPGGGGEVRLEGTSDGKEAKGTWTFKGQDGQATKGSWKLRRKGQ